LVVKKWRPFLSSKLLAAGRNAPHLVQLRPCRRAAQPGTSRAWPGAKSSLLAISTRRRRLSLHFFTTNGTTALQAVKYYEGTLALSYLPTKDVELRTEVRADKANQSVYIDSDGSTKKTLMTFGLQGLYKF